jgi:hypothetical protein
MVEGKTFAPPVRHATAKASALLEDGDIGHWPKRPRERYAGYAGPDDGYGSLHAVPFSSA